MGYKSMSCEARHRVRGISAGVTGAGPQYSGDCESGAGERVEVEGDVAGARSRSGVTIGIKVRNKIQSAQKISEGTKLLETRTNKAVGYEGV